MQKILLPTTNLAKKKRVTHAKYLLMNVSHRQSQLKKYFNGCQDNGTICMLKSILEQIHDIKYLTAI